MSWARRPLFIYGLSRLIVAFAAYLAVALLGHMMVLFLCLQTVFVLLSANSTWVG